MKPGSDIKNHITSFGRRGALAALVGLGSVGFAQETGYSLENAFTALRNTPDWQTVELNYSTAQRNLETAIAGTGLSLSAGGNAGLTQPFDSTLSSNSNASLSVTLSANLLPWSPAYDTIRNAQRALERASLTRRDARNTLALSTVTAYFNARSATFSLQAAQANEALLTTRVRVANLQYQNGQISFADVLTVQQNLATAQSSTLSAQNARLIALAQLGIPEGANLTTAPGQLALPEGTAEGLVRAALERRGDVLQAVSRVQDAEDALANAQRNRLVPNASLSLGYGQLNPTGTLGSPSVTGSINVQTGATSLTGNVPLTNTNTTGGTGVSVSVSASFPVIGPSLDAAVNAAQTALEAARTNLEAVRRTAALDVAQKFSSAQTSTAQIRAAQSVLETARKTLETATSRNQAGLNTAIDLEAARVNLLQAQANLESALASQVSAVYQLQNAIGTLNLIAENR